ncbi:uncharacterized protein FFFS_15817 [Fusarium fujikuroi]|nr:uncharacterized protein FFFS_15817 [Fusarium fujikuroi]
MFIADYQPKRPS